MNKGQAIQGQNFSVHKTGKQGLNKIFADMAKINSHHVLQRQEQEKDRKSSLKDPVRQKASLEDHLKGKNPKAVHLS